jgi:uncharacterized protein (TIGR04255 family)
VNSRDNPLVDPPPREVPLTKAPLVRVIAQVRFGQILSINNAGFIAPFQEAIRRDYPLLQPERTLLEIRGGQGDVKANSSVTAWRFFDASKSWRASLAPDFLALEALEGSYSSRDDFIMRFGRLLEALEQHIDPRVIVRLGVRYIDRVTGTNLEDLPSLVYPEVAGVLASSLAGHAGQALSESIFLLPDDEGRLRARWGLVPAKATVDPSAMTPIGERSWILDLDAFVEMSEPLDVANVTRHARVLAERIYAFFRWVVTPEFLERYGGDV